MPAPSSLTAPSVGDPTRQEWAQGVSDWIAYLSSISGTGGDLVPNGSFEIDSDADGEPDNWTVTTHTGGTFLLDESVSIADDKSYHAIRAAKFTSPGGASNGGGTIATGLMECTEGRLYIVQWSAKNSVADIRNIVTATWYDCTQTLISTTTAYDEATNNPTSWTTLRIEVTPPNQSRYLKLTFNIADTSDSTAGSGWIDEVRIFSLARGATAELFDSSGTFTAPIGVTRVKIRVWGGGGAGASSNTASGAGGGYTEGWYTVIPGRAYTVTRGAGGTPGAGRDGGTSSVVDSVTGTTLISCTGGTGGNGTTNGTGGSGSSGIWSITGQPGETASGGGDCPLGGFGGRLVGANGTAPGGGGSANGGGTAGNGANGRVVIEYGLTL